MQHFSTLRLLAVSTEPISICSLSRRSLDVGRLLSMLHWLMLRGVVLLSRAWMQSLLVLRPRTTVPI
mgnify:CR=1 FL=1